MTGTILKGIIAITPETEGNVLVPNTNFQEVHDLLTQNCGFIYKWSDSGGWVFIKEVVGFEDWIVVTDVPDLKAASVSWGHW